MYYIVKRTKPKESLQMSFMDFPPPPSQFVWLPQGRLFVRRPTPSLSNHLDLELETLNNFASSISMQ